MHKLFKIISNEEKKKHKKYLSLITIRGGDPGRTLQSSWKIAHLNKQQCVHSFHVNE